MRGGARRGASGREDSCCGGAGVGAEMARPPLYYSGQSLGEREGLDLAVRPHDAQRAEVGVERDVLDVVAFLSAPRADDLARSQFGEEPLLVLAVEIAPVRLDPADQLEAAVRCLRRRLLAHAGSLSRTSRRWRVAPTTAPSNASRAERA